MNRSFRAQDSQMQQQGSSRRQGRSNLKEKEEELALFLEMRKREKERNNLLLQNSEEFESPLGSKPGSSPIFKIVQSAPTRKTPTEDFLNSENDKNDYDWLLTPPGTPLFPSLDMDAQKTMMSQLGTPNPRPTALKSRLANAAEPVSRNNFVSRQPISPGLYSSSNGTTRRPSSSGGSGSAASSRPSTPTGRPTLSSTATSRPTLTSTATSRPTLTSTTRASRPSTPTRSTIPSSTKTTAPPVRSRTPARSSTPTSRPSLQASKPNPITAPKSTIPSSRSTIPSVSRPTSRAATPTRRPSTPSTTSAPGPVRSSSVTRSAPMLSTTVKNSVPSRGSSPTVKSRPALWKPSEMPGFSLDAPPNLRTTMPDRPLSATRGRPGGPSIARSASVEPSPAGRPRRTSCSPSRGRAPNHISGGSVPAVSRARINNSDNVSPVQMGNKMVERVVNMRKLAPPRHEDPRSTHNSLSGKTSSPESTGFGRNLSKKSLDMALRHMDIRRSVPGSLRPLMTNIPASSMYSVRSGPRSRPVSVSDSPLATSSNASSERSVNNVHGFGYASEVDDADLGVGLDSGDL